jgi:hypothetical protein
LLILSILCENYRYNYWLSPPLEEMQCAVVALEVENVSKKIFCLLKED